MKNMQIHTEIVRLTENQEWVNCPKTVAYVQTLSKELVATRRSPLNYKSIKGIVVKYSNGITKQYPSLEDCSKEEKLSSVSIQRVIRAKSKTRNGRQFFLI